MKRILLIWLAVALFAGVAAAENADMLGRPFPDFTATDTLGNAWTLSEMLKDHEAVLVNLWATWCPPCEAEFPFLNEAYERYSDRVAFIALSCEADDTPEMIEAYRAAHGIAFPMGRDEGSVLYDYAGGSGIPMTVIVDRFGNAAFAHLGSFISAAEVSRALEAFLGDGYTETAVLDEIPAETSTRAFPVSEARALRVENESARAVYFRTEDDPEAQPAYVIDDDTAHLRLEIAAADNPATMTYYNAKQIVPLTDLLDPARDAFLYDQPMPGPEADRHYVFASLIDGGADADPDYVGIYLISGDAYIGELADDMRSWGYEVTWAYADSQEPAQAPPQAYVLHMADQYGAPVPGVFVNFCTDETCTLQQSGDDGTIVFDGPPDTYHVQLLKVPDGYGFDTDFDMYTGDHYGEWVVRIRKH